MNKYNHAPAAYRSIGTLWYSLQNRGFNPYLDNPYLWQVRCHRWQVRCYPCYTLFSTLFFENNSIQKPPFLLETQEVQINFCRNPVSAGLCTGHIIILYILYIILIVCINNIYLGDDIAWSRTWVKMDDQRTPGSVISHRFQIWKSHICTVPGWATKTQHIEPTLINQTFPCPVEN